jgi:hypothetical protein
VKQSLASKDTNTEAEEATALEAVTRRQPVQIQQSSTKYIRDREAKKNHVNYKGILLLFILGKMFSVMLASRSGDWLLNLVVQT